MDLIDTHAHLDNSRFDEDREEIIIRAREAGVQYIVNIGADVESSQISVDLSIQYEGIYASVGIHPHEASKIDENTYPTLEGLAKKDKVVAIGEIGLDYYYHHSSQEDQQRVFREMIRLAKRLDLPVIIHCRQSEEDTIAILKEEEAQTIGGVFHAFSGGELILSFSRDAGFYLSVCGIVTFPNSKLSEMIKSIPLDRLLIETDCPYLTPVPYRGKRNEPAYLVQTAKRVADISGLSITDVAKISKGNACHLFKKLIAKGGRG